MTTGLKATAMTSAVVVITSFAAFGCALILDIDVLSSENYNEGLTGGANAITNDVWSGAFGDGNSEDQRGAAVAVTGSGDIIITGTWRGSLALSLPEQPCHDDDDVFVMKLDADGNHVWSHCYGGPGIQRGESVAIDSAGDIYVVGSFTGDIDFGGGSQVTSGGFDIFVAKLSAAGEYRWARPFGGSGEDFGSDIAVDQSGGVVVAGYSNGQINFGGGPVAGAGGDDALIIKLSSADGSHLWSIGLGDDSDQRGFGVAVGGAGSIVVTGGCKGTYCFDSMDATPGGGGSDMFVSKLTSDGKKQWMKRFGGTGDQEGRSVAVDAASNIVVGGLFKGVLDFDNGSLPNDGDLDVFVAKLSDLGDPVWVRGFPSNGDQDKPDVAVDTKGNTLVTGSFSNSIKISGTPIDGRGVTDIFVAKFDIDGEHLWSFGCGKIGFQTGASIVSDSADNILVTGSFFDDLDCGISLMNTGGNDVFVLKLKP